MPYKHQVEVINAIKKLRDSGMPVALDLIGPSWGWYGKDVQDEIKNLDTDGTFIQYLGEIPFDILHGAYQMSDAFIFASSCENLPNILIEAMASGIPLACSFEGPMPEVLGVEGFYFDPKLISSIHESLRQLMLAPSKRAIYAQNASQRAKQYSWRACAGQTFEFISTCFGRHS
jgi:glycosyltransferase involved in cell wall biosynthesis